MSINVRVGLYVKSLRYGGTDLLRNSFQFSGAGSATLEVTIAAGDAAVSGAVLDSESRSVPGILVALIPDERSRTDFYRSVITDRNGQFSFDRLPSGGYKVFSWDAVGTAAYYDPDFLKEYESQGRVVRVAEASSQTVDVRLIPAR
jgi:hypothetical protein